MRIFLKKYLNHLRWRHRPAYWDGQRLIRKLGQKQLSNAVDEANRIVQEITIYFEPNHPYCYGHALLDGCFGLYTLLRDQRLLENSSVNLFLVVDDSIKTNRAVIKILDCVKTIFHFKEIIVPTGNSTKKERLFFERMIWNYWEGNGFYVAYPESYEYMRKLREYGFQENVIFKDDHHAPNAVNDFIRYMQEAYKIDPADWPMVKNRMIIATREGNRLILNLGELEAALKRNGYDVFLIDFASLPLRQQIIETLQAEYLLGFYGSNLTNAVFLHPSAKVIALWPKHGKFFISRKWDPIYSAFLSVGVTLIEYDKPDYDQRDEYLRLRAFQAEHGDVGSYPSDFFYEDGNVLKLNPRITLDEIVNAPHPLLYDLVEVNMYIDPEGVIGVLESAKESVEAVSDATMH